MTNTALKSRAGSYRKKKQERNETGNWGGRGGEKGDGREEASALPQAPDRMSLIKRHFLMNHMARYEEQRKDLTHDTASVPENLVHDHHDDLNLLPAWVTPKNRFYAQVSPSPLGEVDLNSRDDEDAL